MSSQTTEQVMGVSSSIINIGAAAVMAPLWEVYDEMSIEFARLWYTYLACGCSIGEASLLAKIDTIIAMQKQKDIRYPPGYGYRAISYIIYGDPTLRLFPVQHMVEKHPGLARRLLQIKHTVGN
jgi:hypothetical protein